MIETLDKAIEFLQNHPKKDMIKKFEIKCDTPQHISKFNIEYFEIKLPSFPGGVKIK